MGAWWGRLLQKGSGPGRLALESSHLPVYVSRVKIVVKFCPRLYTDPVMSLETQVEEMGKALLKCLPYCLLVNYTVCTQWALHSHEIEWCGYHDLTR